MSEQQYQPASLLLHPNISFCLRVSVSPSCSENTIWSPVVPATPATRAGTITSPHYFLCEVAALTLPSLFTCLLPVPPAECELPLQPGRQMAPVPRTESAQQTC